MAKFILKRLAIIIPVLLVISAFVFFALSLGPGDAATVILGPNATVASVAALKTELGLDRNIFLQYADYMLHFFQGDMGTSWLSGVSITSEFFTKLPNTLQLAFYAVSFSVCLGIPLGVLAAVYQNGFLDRVTLVLALFFCSVPAFWIAMMAQIIFAIRLGWLPAVGNSTLKHFILPSVTLGLGGLANLVRMTRASMLDVLSKDFVRTAYSKGASERRVIWKHVIRNGLLPVITGIGNTITTLISGAIVIEMVFSIPGVGTMLVYAVRNRDIPSVMGPLIYVAMFVCIINLVVDILYAVIDPRVRMKYSKRG